MSRDLASRSGRLFANVVGYGTIVATLAMLFFFLVIPVTTIVVKAFYNGEELTLSYFSLLWNNPLQIEAVYNSLLIGIATTILTTVLCLPLALVNTRCDYPGKTLMAGLLLVPMVMPPFVGAIGVQRFFALRGSVNQLLDRLGLVDMSDPIDWFGGEIGWIYGLNDGINQLLGSMGVESYFIWLPADHRFWAVVLLEVLHLYPIMYLNVTAALANIDPSMEEMSETLGVPRWRQYRDIIWPLVRPGYFAGAIIVFIWALTDLGTPLLVGYHETMPVRIFTLVTDVNENPVGFALVFVVILLTVAVFAASKWATMSGQRYAMLARGHVTSAVRRVGGLRLAAVYGLMLGTVGVALIPHFSVFLTSISDEWFLTILPESYTARYYGMLGAEVVDYVTEGKSSLAAIGIANSLMLAGAATLLDLVLGMLVAYVVVRRLVPLADLLDSLVMIPLALPGIVLAFGYVVTYTGTWLDPLNNPIPLLIIAYAIRRLPYMVRSAAAGLQQTSASLEEASATFGASRFYTLRMITVPLVMANLIAGSLLCFAYAMLDVSDSLILAMKEQFYPITKAIYALFLEQTTGEYMASALGMIAMLILTASILGASAVLGKKMGELFRGG